MHGLQHSTFEPATVAHTTNSSGRNSSIGAKCLNWQQRIRQCTKAQQCSFQPRTHQQHRHQQEYQPVHSSRRRHVAAHAAVTEPSAISSGSSEYQPQQQQQQQQSAIPAVGAELVVVCDRLGTEGVGVCTAPPSRFVLLIKGALPGEQLVAKITAVKKGYAEGVKLSTLRPHSNAVNPQCQHFGTCGGCSLQTLAYDAQLNHKVDHVAQLLTRVGKLSPDLVAATQLDPIAAAEDQIYGYRNKMQLAFSSKVWQAGTSSSPSSSSSGADHLGGDGSSQTTGSDVLQGSGPEGRVVDGWGLGYYLPGSNQVVMPVEECSLVAPEVNQIISAVRRCCQQHGLQPYNPVTGQGQLRHLIIRTASATAAVVISNSSAVHAAGSSSSRREIAPTLQIMAVLVTTEPCESAQLQQVADQLMHQCSDLGLVSVIHSTEAAGAAAANGSANSEQPASSSSTKSKGRNLRKSKSSRGRPSSSGSSNSNRQPRGIRALSVSSSRVLCGVPHLTEQLCGLQFHISPHSFFQTNTGQAELLYEQVTAAVQGYYQAAADGLQAGSGQHSGVVLDLYTGTGTIALSIASSNCCKEVVGFDISESSIKDAQVNAARNGVSNARFVCGDLTQLARGDLLGPGLRPDVVVVDPARAGLGMSVIDYVLRCGAQRLIYVSCNAATQSRDLQLLCQAGNGGGFKSTSWVAVDMYPQTGVEHVETVVVLDKA